MQGLRQDERHLLVRGERPLRRVLAEDDPEPLARLRRLVHVLRSERHGGEPRVRLGDGVPGHPRDVDLVHLALGNPGGPSPREVEELARTVAVAVVELQLPVAEDDGLGD